MSEPLPLKPVANLLTLIRELPENRHSKVPDTPIEIAGLPESLQRPEVLRVAEREAFAQGVAWSEGSPSYSRQQPNGDFMFAIGTSEGWLWAAGTNRKPTHVQLLRKGWAWLDRNALGAKPEPAVRTKKRGRVGMSAETREEDSHIYDAHHGGTYVDHTEAVRELKRRWPNLDEEKLHKILDREGQRRRRAARQNHTEKPVK